MNKGASKIDQNIKLCDKQLKIVENIPKISLSNTNVNDLIDDMI